MRTALLIIYSVVVLFQSSVLRFLDKDQLNGIKNESLRASLNVVSENKLLVSVVCGIVILLYGVLPRWFTPWKSKKKLLNGTLQRMFGELFKADLEKHRLTLFKEVGYLQVLWIQTKAFFRCVWKDRKKCRAYMAFPKWGRYLMVYRRYGTYEKSLTLLRVDFDDAKGGSGVASYIRHKGMAVKVASLPCLDGIDISPYSSLSRIPEGNRAVVKEYMDKGLVSDFSVLKKINRKAQHFYGCPVSERDGKPWGVLLADSVGDADPFDDTTQTRFLSFAVTVGGIISLEA